MQAQPKMFRLITILLVGWIEGLMMLHASAPHADVFLQNIGCLTEICGAAVIAWSAQNHPWVARQHRWITWAGLLWVLGIGVAEISLHLGLTYTRIVQLTACTPLLWIWSTKGDAADLLQRRNLLVVWPGATFLAQTIALAGLRWPWTTEPATLSLMTVTALLLCWPKPWALVSSPIRSSHVSPPIRWNTALMLLILGYAVSIGIRVIPADSRLSVWHIIILASLAIVMPALLALLPHQQLQNLSGFFVATLLLWDLLRDVQPTSHLMAMILALSALLTVNAVLLSQAATARPHSAESLSRTSWQAPAIFVAGWAVGWIPALHQQAPVFLAMALLTIFFLNVSTRTKNDPWPNSPPAPVVSFEREDIYTRLTPQERRIVGLLVDGYSNQDIIKELYVSINTLKTHLKNIYRKTQTKNRRELVDRLTHPDHVGPPTNRRIR
jgi:DNA-binding CsgD family transcriptional regulator